MRKIEMRKIEVSFNDDEMDVMLEVCSKYGKSVSEIFAHVKKSILNNDVDLHLEEALPKILSKEELLDHCQNDLHKKFVQEVIDDDEEVIDIKLSEKRMHYTDSDYMCYEYSYDDEDWIFHGEYYTLDDTLYSSGISYEDIEHSVVEKKSCQTNLLFYGITNTLCEIFSSDYYTDPFHNNVLLQDKMCEISSNLRSYLHEIALSDSLFPLIFSLLLTRKFIINLEEFGFKFNMDKKKKLNKQLLFQTLRPISLHSYYLKHDVSIKIASKSYKYYLNDIPDFIVDELETYYEKIYRKLLNIKFDNLSELEIFQILHPELIQLEDKIIEIYEKRDKQNWEDEEPTKIDDVLENCVVVEE